MRFASPLLALALACPWAHAQGDDGLPADPMPRPSWQKGARAYLRSAGHLRSTSPTWEGETERKSYFGFSLDPDHEIQTRVSITRRSSPFPLINARENSAPELFELRAGRSVSVRGKGLNRSGPLDTDLLIRARRAGWGLALENADLEGLALMVGDSHYALLIRSADLERARARWQRTRKGKLLARRGSDPRLLDRLLPWLEWEHDQGAGVAPFSLSGDRIEPTPWRFVRSELGDLQLLLLSRDLPQLARTLQRLGIAGLPADLPQPAELPQPVEIPAQVEGEQGRAGGLAQALGGGDAPRYGETRLGLRLFRKGDRLFVLDGYGVRHAHDPARHGDVQREPPLPPNLGIARKDGRVTYLVRLAGRVHALFMGTLTDYHPAKHGEVEVQPPLDESCGATVWGYPLVTVDGETYVLREELPPARHDPGVHGRVHTLPPQ